MAKILLAEDSPDIRVLIQMILEQAGHEVVSAADGREAVSSALKVRPDLVLMDLSLPLLSGWEAAREIRANPATASIPILAVTAHAMQGDRERALAAGCDGFIPKPIDEETFAVRIGSFLDARSRRPGTPSETVARASEEPGRILVVDDQAELASLLKTELESDGHEVVVATGAAEASELFRDDRRFDLAVIDVILGDESGYTLASELNRSASPDYIPVLLLTAGTIDREKAYGAGADDFVGKPVESIELRIRARSLIRVGRAIREQSRIGRERSEAYRTLAELDRLRSDFLSTVSHELRTPLNTIILLAHQLEKTAKSRKEEERRIRDAKLLRESAEALRRMIDNILDLAKLEAGETALHPQPIPTREFLRETADLVEPQARVKGLALTIETSPELPETVVLDREKLFRVLINLLSNAVKYTPQGQIILRAFPWQESVTWAVEDTGVGIPSDLIATAFEPFRQIRPATGETHRGTGLGLTISKHLVEMMGGDLFLDSREGRGTKVSFTLPQLREEDPEALASREAERGVSDARPTEPGPRQILIVEDDDASRYGLRALLQGEGYEVLEASTLRETDGLLEKSQADLLILDITLPDGDGAVWLKRRAEKGSSMMPVIALSGVTSDEDRRRIEGAGVLASLTKPVNVRRLLKLVRDCWSAAAPR